MGKSWFVAFYRRASFSCCLDQTQNRRLPVDPGCLLGSPLSSFFSCFRLLPFQRHGFSLDDSGVIRRKPGRNCKRCARAYYLLGNRLLGHLGAIEYCARHVPRVSAAEKAISWHLLSKGVLDSAAHDSHVRQLFWPHDGTVPPVRGVSDLELAGCSTSHGSFTTNTLVLLAVLRVGCLAAVMGSGSSCVSSAPLRPCHNSASHVERDSWGYDAPQRS